MKILVINHSNNYIYGASKSLQSLLNTLDIEYDFVAPKSILEKTSEEMIRQNFTGKLNHIYSFWLPYVLYVNGRESRSFKGRIYHIIINILYLFNKRKISRLCQSKCYDIVYLNSSVLFPIINNKANYVIHIREVFKGTQREFKCMESKLNKAKGVVFIDNATFQAFSNCELNYLLLSNPFDMRRLNDLSSHDILEKYQLDNDKVIFSILGKLIKLKGVDIVIEAFNQLKTTQATLLIVGELAGGNSIECQNLAKTNQNIHFLGELKNTDEIYKISDYIVRGDRVVALGRTTYEGLYASCDVIIPTQDGSNTFEELVQFENQCHTYKVESVESLKQVMNECLGKKVVKKRAQANLDSYIKDFQAFINKIIS